MGGIFLDASILRNTEVENIVRYNIQQNRILFDFPDGFTQLRLIEECRALNALDITNPDNFDLMYDITMQMLTGKVCFIYFVDENSVRHELGRFVVTDRYMNLRTIDVFDEYPVLMNWIVEFIAGYLGKKYPHSLKDFQVTMSAREEHLKNLKSKNIQTVRQGK